MITVGLKLWRMLRFEIRSGLRKAGVMQLAPTLLIAGAIVVCECRSGFAQDACASGATEQADAQSGEGWSCGEVAPDLDLSLPASHALPLASPKDEPVKLPAAVSPAVPLPIAITPGETGAGARISLQTLRDYNAQIASQKADALKSSAGAAIDAMPAPKAPVSQKSALEIWSSVDAQGFDAAAGRATKTGAGLDYRVVKNASVGVSAERADQVAPSAGASGSTDEKVSAYVAFKALSAVSVDARTQWERGDTAAAGPQAGASEKSSLIVAPRIGKAFTLEGGHTLEPYVEVKREIGLGKREAEAGLAGNDSAGAGVNFSKTGGYAVSVTADVDGVGANAPANVNGKVQFKLPLD